MTRSLTILVLCLLGAVCGLTAQDVALTDKALPAGNPVTSAAPAEEPEEDDNTLPFEISGAVDAYYLHSFGGGSFPTSFTENSNGFTLGMANVILSREGAKVGFVADLAVGPRAETANGFAGTTLSVIKQLYVTYSPFEVLTFTAGNFGTFVGYEVIDAPANINYSTSYLFSNGPFFHTGVKADLALSSAFGLMLGVFDDTDSKFDFTGGKHFGAQLSYAAGDFEVYLNYLTGQDVDGIRPEPDVHGHQIDLVATFQATEALGLGLNASSKTNVFSEGPNTSWSGAALYANYAFSPAFTLGLRGEYISDPDGEILGAANGDVLGLTLSGNFHVGELTIIPEFRLDSAGAEVFTDSDGLPTSSLPAFLVAAVYAF